MRDSGAYNYRRYLAGDDDAMFELVREHREGLTLFVFGMTRNFHDAEDVVANTFFVLAAKKPRFNGRSKFKTWLFAIAKKQTLAYLRKNAREVPGHDASLLVGPDAELASLEEAYLESERAIEFYNSLTALPEGYGEVLHLKHIEGFSNEEVALVLKKSKRQVENMLHRAKKRYIELRGAGEADAATADWSRL